MAKKRIPKVQWPPKAKPEFSFQKAKPEFPPRAKPDLRRSAKKSVRPARLEPTIDPLIKRRLLVAKPDDVLSIIFSVRPGKKEDYSPGWVKRTVSELLERVAREISLRATGIKIFENLDSAGITARPLFLRTLLQQKEIIGAQDANHDLPDPGNDEDPPAQ